MFLKIWLNYLTGYVRIKVDSFYIERFINICISRNIFLWSIKRKKYNVLYANININDYKKIREIAKKTKSKIKIEGKKGIPFVLNKYKKRKIFILPLVALLIIIIISSNFVWNIEIRGNEKINKDEIIQELENVGLKVGTSKKKINVKSIINKIRLNRNDIAWIGINLKGTNVIVEIKEARETPKIIDINEYCNIVANKEGTITKIEVQNGTANVNVGDTVNVGDILVLGYLEGKYTGIRYVHGMANIEAKIKYSKKEKFFYKQQIKERTSATEEKYSIKIKNFKINLYKTLSKFQNYDTICVNKNLKLFSNFYLPLELIKITNFEYKNVEKTYTETELKEIGTQKLENEIMQTIENKENIINKEVNTYGNEEYIEIEVIYEVLENIGIENKIEF